MTVSWPYGLADPGLYAYLMTAAAHANLNGYPYPALQSAVQSPFSPYYPATSLSATRPSPYPTYNAAGAAAAAATVRDSLLQKSQQTLLDTMSSLSQASLFQQSLAKSTNNNLDIQLQNSPTNSSCNGLLTTAHQTNPLAGHLFQPYKE